MKVQCNNMKCKAEWELKEEGFVISGNRIVAGPPMRCPKCDRIDRPYILPADEKETVKELKLLVLKEEIEVALTGMKLARLLATTNPLKRGEWI